MNNIFHYMCFTEDFDTIHQAKHFASPANPSANKFIKNDVCENDGKNAIFYTENSQVLLYFWDMRGESIISFTLLSIGF